MTMKNKKLWVALGAFVLGGMQPLFAQGDSLRFLNEVSINSSRAGTDAPLSTSLLDKEQLEERRSESSIPYMVELQPSVVASGENGRTGNTSLRIRGVDGSRINVNINGIPLNDAESQSVFWVNIPNLSGMAQSMQIQRGVGSTTGGSAAFGGAVNMQTLNAGEKPYAHTDVGLGAWNTRQFGFTAGTGVGKHGLAFDAAYSSLTSDGYVRGGFCDHQSLLLSGGYYGEKTLLKAIVILGDQHTGITWDGATAEELEADPRYNPSGIWLDGQGNTRYYDNESDNYRQRHYQIYLSHLISENWMIRAAADLTRGDGYYEQYKYRKSASLYGMGPDTSDFITRKEMSNTAYTGTLALHYQGKGWDLALGEMSQFYDGNHFGEVVWMKDSVLADPYEWYRNKGIKKESSTFLRFNGDLGRSLNGYLDLQLRLVGYSIEGPDEDFTGMDFCENYRFFNPKMGLNWTISERERGYMAVGLSGREPTRADIKDILKTAGDTIRAEHLLDMELGYRYSGSRFAAAATAYAMLYRDQLTASGEISSSGYALMVNVDRSYRIGMELEAGYRVNDWWRMEGNLTLSRNRILDYQLNDSVNLGTTDLSFSPGVVGAAVATFEPYKALRLQLVGKYVGEMYCDNSSRAECLQEDYFQLNLKASYTWNLEDDDQLEAQLVVNNVLNHSYRISAWVSEDAWGLYRGYYQQPGINLMARIILKF